MATQVANGRAGDPSVPELMRQLSQLTAQLAHQEVQLAKAELEAKGKRAGIGAGMFGGSAVVGVLAAGALVAAGILLLATAVAPWVAAAIVGGGLGIVAGVLALTGLGNVKRATPPVPEQAADSVRADLQTAKAAAAEGRR